MMTTFGLGVIVSPLTNDQAVVLVADKKFSLKVTGLGDVLAPNGGVIGEFQSTMQAAIITSIVGRCMLV